MSMRTCIVLPLTNQKSSPTMPSASVRKLEACSTHLSTLLQSRTEPSAQEAKPRVHGTEDAGFDKACMPWALGSSVERF